MLQERRASLAPGLEKLMLIKGWGEPPGRRFLCLVCGKQLRGLNSMEVCPDCVRERWGECKARLEAIHDRSRTVFQLPLSPPRNPAGTLCNLCSNSCRMGAGEKGYCGVRTGDKSSLRRDGRSRARMFYYYDPLPTNCVADWVCAGGTGAGYPAFSNDRGAEVGFHNLAVCFEACNFNCLYCQNWCFKKPEYSQVEWQSTDALAEAVTRETSCICYFGGDPTPQVPYAIRVSERVRLENPDKILRICWETNGNAHPAWMRQMAKLSLESGGCVKVDLKAWNPNIHKALCGTDNRRVLENFAMLASMGALRKEPPLLVASTLLVPHFVCEEEVAKIAAFIASLDPDIPYVLLAFAPQFCLEDFPTTARADAEACLEAAKRAGLRRVRIGNRHLLH